MKSVKFFNKNAKRKESQVWKRQMNSVLLALLSNSPQPLALPWPQFVGFDPRQIWFLKHMSKSKASEKSPKTSIEKSSENSFYESSEKSLLKKTLKHISNILWKSSYESSKKCHERYHEKYPKNLQKHYRNLRAQWIHLNLVSIADLSDTEAITK